MNLEKSIPCILRTCREILEIGMKNAGSNRYSMGNELNVTCTVLLVSIVKLSAKKCNNQGSNSFHSWMKIRTRVPISTRGKSNSVSHPFAVVHNVVNFCYYLE